MKRNLTIIVSVLLFGFALINTACSENEHEKLLLWTNKGDEYLYINDVSYKKNTYCVVGNLYDIEKTRGDAILFVIENKKATQYIIKTPKDYNASFATRCLIKNNKFYITYRIQTHSSQSINQKLLYLIAFHYTNGKITEFARKKIPANYSATDYSFCSDDKNINLEAILEGKNEEFSTLTMQFDENLEVINSNEKNIVLDEALKIFRDLSTQHDEVQKKYVEIKDAQTFLNFEG